MRSNRSSPTSIPPSMRPRPEGRGERPSPPVGARSHERTFNAATTRRSWRTTVSLSATASHSTFNAATTRRSWRTIYEAFNRPNEMSFNAATTRRSWRTLLARREPDLPLWPFNAATTRRSWRTGAGAALPASIARPSMRPRPEGRGELRRHHAAGRACRAFNAATTRRSWRTLGCLTTLAALTTFNAATTRRSWRTPTPPARTRWSRTAFNAATTRRSWRTKIVCHWPALVQNLQCGHDPKVVENISPLTSFDAGISRPSMRPRPEGRGERRVHDFLLQGWGPSMRPRPEGRGERERPGTCRPARRTFNAATTRRSWRTPK